MGSLESGIPTEKQRPNIIESHLIFGYIDSQMI